MPSLEVRHYETPQGHDPIAEFLDQLPVKAAAKCTVVIGWLASGEVDRHRNAREPRFTDERTATATELEFAAIVAEQRHARKLSIDDLAREIGIASERLVA